MACKNSLLMKDGPMRLSDLNDLLKSSPDEFWREGLEAHMELSNIPFEKGDIEVVYSCKKKEDALRKYSLLFRKYSPSGIGITAAQKDKYFQYLNMADLNCRGEFYKTAKFMASRAKQIIKRGVLLFCIEGLLTLREEGDVEKTEGLLSQAEMMDDEDPRPNIARGIVYYKIAEEVKKQAYSDCINVAGVFNSFRTNEENKRLFEEEYRNAFRAFRDAEQMALHNPNFMDDRHLLSEIKCNVAELLYLKADLELSAEYAHESLMLDVTNKKAMTIFNNISEIIRAITVPWELGYSEDDALN